MFTGVYPLWSSWVPRFWITPIYLHGVTAPYPSPASGMLLQCSIPHPQNHITETRDMLIES